MGVRKYGLVAASDVKVRDPANPVNQANMQSASHMMAGARNHPILSHSPMPHLIRPGAEWARVGRTGGRLGSLMVDQTRRTLKQRKERIAGERETAMNQHPAATNMYASPVFGASAASTVGAPGSYYSAPSGMGARATSPGPDILDVNRPPSPLERQVATVNPLMPEDTLHDYAAPKMMGSMPASRMAKFAQGRGA